MYLFIHFSYLKIVVLLFYVIIGFFQTKWCDKSCVSKRWLTFPKYWEIIWLISQESPLFFPCFLFLETKVGYFGNWVTWIFVWFNGKFELIYQISKMNHSEHSLARLIKFRQSPKVSFMGNVSIFQRPYAILLKVLQFHEKWFIHWTWLSNFTISNSGALIINVNTWTWFRTIKHA